eukprot:4535776-Pleurochrysis_carterae.AAC.1
MRICKRSQCPPQNEAAVRVTQRVRAMADDEAETCICSACKHLMVDPDGNPRAPRTCAHSCSRCELTLHAPMVCEFV